ncbi:MAG: ABC transporter ATP-binding protein, partial [Sarcina sp.]
LIMVSMLFIMIPRAAASADRINKVLAMEPSIADPENPTSNFAEQGSIEFRNVSFAFPGAENNALSNINFRINPGETTAIIGGTGSGKSTVLNLISRFYDSTEGEILVNGTDIKTLPLELLRSKLGFVPQKAVLFSGTIEENLKYGKKDATMDEMIHASQVAQSYDFILNKEDGFNSVVEQGGRNFSGGQKQRLSIARALVRRPDVYMFDDSFSALDFKTDAKLRAALKKETNNAAVLIVAQRINTIKDADNILVINEGKIVGHGTHKELLNTCPVYQEIASSQLSKEELENE